MSKIIGVTVGTPTSARKIEDELKPVKSVNGKSPDENGNVEIEAGGGTSLEVDTTLTQSGKAADAKAVGDALAALSGANSELPFTENEISGVVSGGGFGTNHTNFADGKTYFRYHAGSSYGFKWKNPNPQKGSLTITMRGYSQYSTTLSTKIVTVYTDGTDNSLSNMMYLKHGETITYTTDPDKTVDYIRGNYDFENWVLLDMDVLSIVADYPAPTGTVKSVNGILPDENGNVKIEIPEGGGGSGGEWTKLGSITLTGTFEKIASYENGIITFESFVPNEGKSYNITNKDGTELVHCGKFSATDNAGEYKIKNMDGVVVTPTIDIANAFVQNPDAEALVIDNQTKYKRYKTRVSTPLFNSHSSRMTYLFSYGRSGHTAKSLMSNLAGRSLVYETEEVVVGNDIYVKQFGCCNRTSSYNMLYANLERQAATNETKWELRHYNGLLTIGTQFEVWGAY